jgi:hypothetical protein
MRHPSSAPRSALVLAGVLLAAVAACRPASGVESDDRLPPEFTVRSDVPYVRGTIRAREDAAGALRLRVEDAPGSTARVTAAFVTVLPEAVLRYRDGRRATPADLRVGRVVTVWVTGPELRSSPPQVSANGIIVER